LDGVFERQSKQSSGLTREEYLADAGVWRFLTATLTTFKSNIALQGVFPPRG